MMSWWKKLGKNHKGFSLVELICTVAIFSIIITGVGSAMVISARSYSNGNVELDLQQQAQITANLLTNLIIDANVIEEPSSEAGGSLLRIKKEEAGVMVLYEVTHDAANQQLLYSREGGTAQVLAEHISAFSISRVSSNNIDFSLRVTEGTRSYESDYHVTPRNGASEETNTALGGAKSLYVENKLILEPGQGMTPGEEYDLAVRITGTSIQDYAIANLSGNVSSSTAVTKVDSHLAQIKVGLDETGTGVGDDAHFSFDVVPTDSSVAPINVKVYVRRVNSVNVNGFKIGGKVNKSGATYKVTAPLLGTTLEKEPGVWYDVDYVNPYTVGWSYEFTKTDADGNTTIVPFDSMCTVVGQGVEGNVPYVIVKLTNDLTPGCELKVTGTALHPEGRNPVDSSIQTNKSGLKYGTVSDFWILDYEAWKRNGKLDIAVHHLGDENFWFNPDGSIMYKWNARVKFSAYDSAGNFLPALAGDFDPWQREQHLPIKADLDLNNIRDKWDLTLMPYHETNTAWDWGPSYTLPYILAYYNTPAEGFNRGWYIYNAAPSFVNPGLGVAGYRIELNYQYLDESGNLVNDTVIENYEVEEVAALYRNALDSGCSWQRENKIFVTTADAINDYKVHFKFDRGWDKDDHDYYFIDMRRFIGVVADRPGYLNDVRRDITVTGMEKKKDVPDGDSVLTFTLTAADKAECKALADKADGTITMIYEYNPFLGRLPLEPKTETELRAEHPEWNNDSFWTYYNAALNADPLNPQWYKEKSMPMNVGGITLTQDIMDSIKGCEGHVVFCFKDPNIDVRGAVTPKVMYCPTLTEYGPLYYIDDTTRFAINASAAQYQEYVGGSWITSGNLAWDATANGWIMN